MDLEKSGKRKNTDSARAEKWSPEETNMLAQTIASHHQKLFGPLSNSVSSHTKDTIWSIVVDSVNAVSKTKRDQDQCRIKWRDLKSKAKKQAHDLQKSRNQTGGGEKDIEDTDDVLELVADCEQWVKNAVKVLGKTAISGIKGGFDSAQAKKPKVSLSLPSFSDDQLFNLPFAKQQPCSLGSYTEKLSLAKEFPSTSRELTLYSKTKQPAAILHKETEVSNISMEPNSEHGVNNIENAEDSSTRANTNSDVFRGVEYTKNFKLTKNTPKRSYVNEKIREEVVDTHKSILEEIKNLKNVMAENHHLLKESNQALNRIAVSLENLVFLKSNSNGIVQYNINELN